jgi:hypothetical protein
VVILPPANAQQIPRGADLTDEDIAVLADDAIAVCRWTMRNAIRGEGQHTQVREALRARLGRRPIVLPTGDKTW